VIGQIIAYNMTVLLVIALVLANLCKYRHKSYIAENYIVDSVYYIFVAATSTQLTPKAISSVE